MSVWNQDLPKSFILTGKDPHQRADRAWNIAGLEFRHKTLIISGQNSLNFPLTLHFHGTIITRTGTEIIITNPGEEEVCYPGDQELEFDLP